ncbi:serine--tRNA synthetase-like protein Slimp [Ctenocephalides felis]|uniref:serine--tRNA synthetase-like protein Slimp n=1 Tax=Ctenocephalides felis TaxID=7515 RepID=UPI000E6E31E4|nr:serine--tRNA synthetase-like protein Slimp [Ctenocephalides felis]
MFKSKLFSFTTKIIKPRFYSSALYVTGDKATATCALLTPYIDLKNFENNFDNFTNNAKHRHLDVDFGELQKLWFLYQDLDKTRRKLDACRTSIADKVKTLDKSGDEFTKLINQGKIVRDDLKMLKDCFQPVQENLVTQLLRLPNVLHELTPLEDARVDFTFLDKPGHKSEHHTAVGGKLGLLNFMNQYSYYLLNDAALLEIDFITHVNRYLDQHDFIPFTLPDFARSAILEGCGVDYTNLNQFFTIQDPDGSDQDISKLHLVGTASLYSFMAYHTKLMLYPSAFPLNYYSSGRQYKPSTNIDKGLLEPSQSTCFQIFTATLQSQEQMEQEFLKLQNLCTNLYKSFTNYHFRVVYQPAWMLDKSESCRLSFQMFSSHFQEYVEVGHLSMYDDYISKRLLFTYKEGKVNVFPKVISGTVVNFAKVFACVLENYPDRLVVPDVINI